MRLEAAQPPAVETLELAAVQQPVVEAVVLLPFLEQQALLVPLVQQRAVVQVRPGVWVAALQPVQRRAA